MLLYTPGVVQQFICLTFYEIISLYLLNSVGVLVSPSGGVVVISRGQLFTAPGLVSTFYTSQGDIYSKFEIAKRSPCTKWPPCQQVVKFAEEFLFVCSHIVFYSVLFDWILLLKYQGRLRR